MILTACGGSTRKAPSGHLGSLETDLPKLCVMQRRPRCARCRRRRRGGEEALVWLAQRVAGWGRVYVIEALCRHGAYGASRRWLLRHACDGDFLNGYFAGQVATAAHLHEAIVGTKVDDDLVDHTGRLLKIMAGCSGMGMTLDHYPPAPTVLTAHAAHLGRQAPTVARYVDAAVIADHLADKASDRCGCTTEQRDLIVQRYIAVLDRPDWCDTVRAGLDSDSDFFACFADNVAARLHLRAFSNLTGGHDR